MKHFRRRTKRQKWTIWLIGFLTTYFFQNVNLRPRVYLKSIEEYVRLFLTINSSYSFRYKKTALPN